MNTDNYVAAVAEMIIAHFAANSIIEDDAYDLNSYYYPTLKYKCVYIEIHVDDCEVMIVRNKLPMVHQSFPEIDLISPDSASQQTSKLRAKWTKEAAEDNNAWSVRDFKLYELGDPQLLDKLLAEAIAAEREYDLPLKFINLDLGESVTMVAESTVCQ